MQNKLKNPCIATIIDGAIKVDIYEKLTLSEADKVSANLLIGKLYRNLITSGEPGNLAAFEAAIVFGMELAENIIEAVTTAIIELKTKELKLN